MKSKILPLNAVAFILACSMVSQLHGTTVFNTTFTYAGGDPTVTTDAAALNGADGQIGSFSGTVPNNLMAINSGRLLSDAHDTVSGATTDWSFDANLSDDVNLAGSSVSFDWTRRRTATDDLKDSDIAGYSSTGEELFRVRFSVDGVTVGQSLRLGTVNGLGAVDWDLDTVIGNDADDDIIDLSGVNISFALSATGYAISLDGANDYTTSEIAFNTIGSNLSYLTFEGQGGDANSDRSGYYLDNIVVTGTIPEPGTFALLAGLTGLTFVMLRRRRA